MTTSTSKTPRTDASPGFGADRLDLDTLSSEELEALLFEDDAGETHSFWNVPTVAGLALIIAGVVYLLAQMGLFADFEAGELATLLPILGGVLIILTGLGVLSRRPGREREEKKAVDLSSGKKKVIEEPNAKRTHRLTRSKRHRKIFGVCGGIAERLDIDPTLVRIAFVIGTIFSGGPPFVIAYLALAYVMPEPDAVEERVTVVRDA